MDNLTQKLAPSGYPTSRLRGRYVHLLSFLACEPLVRTLDTKPPCHLEITKDTIVCDFINNTFSTFNFLNVLLLALLGSQLTKKVLSKKAKKLVHWHDNYVVFVTPEAKALKWDDKTIVKISVVEEKGEKKIVIEKGMEL